MSVPALQQQFVAAGTGVAGAVAKPGPVDPAVVSWICSMSLPDVASDVVPPQQGAPSDAEPKNVGLSASTV
jgi:hypothetical protein